MAQCVIRAHLPDYQRDHFRQQLVEEASAVACASSRTGGAASGGGGSGGGKQRQQSQQETLSPQQLRECVSQRHVPGGVEAGSLGASESASTGAASAEPLLTFLLDLDASCGFFRDCTTITPLTTHVPLTLADTSSHLVVARGTTVLPCPAVPCGSLTGFHLPSFAMNFVSQAVLQDRLVTTTNLGGQLVAICTDPMTGDHLGTFTRRPRSGLYILHVEFEHFAGSGQVAASCSGRSLTHLSLLLHHHFGHPSLQRLRRMYLRLLVSGLPRSLPPLPPSLALPCTPCVEGWQRATPHSSFPPTEAPL
ncbi:unnamed protein product [Closterium sp. NIES-54]